MSEEGTFPLKKAYDFLALNNKQTVIYYVKNELKIPDTIIKRSSFRRGYLIKYFNEQNLLQEFLNRYWNTGLTAQGQTKMKYYLNYYQSNSK